MDTNIFLDLALKRDNGCKDAIEFFIWCRKYRNQTYVTSMSIRDIEYVAVKYLHDRKKANAVISNVYSLVSKVIGISADCAINAIYEDYKDYEDELIVQAAKENLLDAIVTNNISQRNYAKNIFCGYVNIQLSLIYKRLLTKFIKK